MREKKTMAVTPMLFGTLLALVLWMTIPIGLQGLLSSGDSTSASLLAMGVATAILAVVPAVRKRILGGRLPRANALYLVFVLVLLGILQVVKLVDLRNFAAFGLGFELIDKIVLLALLALASIEIVVGTTKAST